MIVMQAITLGIVVGNSIGIFLIVRYLIKRL